MDFNSCNQKKYELNGLFLSHKTKAISSANAVAAHELEGAAVDL